MKKHRIIDIHTHQPLYQEDGSTYSVSDSARLLLEQLDLGGVQMAGLLGYSVSPGKSVEEMRFVNQQTSEVIACDPERLLGFVFVNPSLPASIVAGELDQYLSQGGFRGIKLELDVNCRDPRVNVVMEKARQYNVPVLHHSWYVNTWCMNEGELQVQLNRSEPHDVADLARRFPDVPIIMAHMEGSGIRGILDVAECGNVWIDTSGSQPFTGTLEFALETVGSRRILFGSDLCGRSIEGQLGRILGTRMPEADRENILWRNAETLLGLRAQ